MSENEQIRTGSRLTNGQIALFVTLLIVLIDQIIKVYVKTHYYLGEETRITSWFRIVFVENNGMAFGWEIGSKLFLTLFRIVFVGFIIYYILKIKNLPSTRPGFIVCASLILAGAIGNIIDCMFYGLVFNNPMPPEVASFLPPGGGYGEFLHGRVVDMFFFPLFSFNWPEWMPLVGGQHFLFFQPVFNFADAAITVGILVFIIFYSKNFKFSLNPEPSPADSQNNGSEEDGVEKE